MKCGDCGNIIADSEKPGSAVRAILEQSLEGMDTAQRNQLVKAILNARNSLQHGGLPDSIERKTGFAIHQLADVLGKTTFNYIMHDMNKLAAFPQLQLLVPSTYANSSLNYKMSGFIESSTSDASEPNPSDYDGIRVSMIRSLQKKKPAPN